MSSDGGGHCDIAVVGGGLAGSEAAWQLAERGFRVRLLEMRPLVQTPAHQTDMLAEVVCSNSLGGEGKTCAAGILKAELALGRSLIMHCAEESRVPAGGALAVDRTVFSALVTKTLAEHPNVTLERVEATAIPEGPVVIASGPLTSPALAAQIQGHTGAKCLSFFDAVAPIVTLASVDMDNAYVAGRYGRGSDYVNCPLNKEQYLAFYEFLTHAERALPHDFEDASYFEGCMPVEVMAGRGVDTLRFGPMKPVGLPDPHTGHEPYAVVQLRQDNREGTLYNLVGFQTGLKWGEQSKLLALIPALARAEIVRFGVMHRNIYVKAPTALDASLRLRGTRDDVFLAGQITGVEGYMESTAMGLAAAVFAACFLRGLAMPVWPRETAMGSLLHYLQDAEPDSFQPMNTNLGIFPPLPQRVKDKKLKASLVYERSLAAAGAFWEKLAEMEL